MIPCVRLCAHMCACEHECGAMCVQVCACMCLCMCAPVCACACVCACLCECGCDSMCAHVRECPMALKTPPGPSASEGPAGNPPLAVVTPYGSLSLAKALLRGRGLGCSQASPGATADRVVCGRRRAVATGTRRPQEPRRRVGEGEPGRPRRPRAPAAARCGRRPCGEASLASRPRSGEPPGFLEGQAWRASQWPGSTPLGVRGGLSAQPPREGRELWGPGRQLGMWGALQSPQHLRPHTGTRS